MNKKLELSTFLGITAALLLIVAAILAGNGRILSFLDLPSVFIVVGGTFFVTCACFSINDVVKALAASGQTMLYAAGDRKQLVAACLKLAELSRRDGILNVQRAEGYNKMPQFFKKYAGLVMDGLSQQDTEKLIVQEMTFMRERHLRSASILRKGSEIAPAMGLVGTLIGLVQMLGNLDDPSRIGPAMALALLTTLYGAITAYVILIPLANKLERNSGDEFETMRLYGETVLAIAGKESPMKLEMRMNTTLSPEERVKIYS